MAYTYNPNTHDSVGEQAKLSSKLLHSFLSDITNSLDGQVQPVTDFIGNVPIDKAIVQLHSLTGYDVHFPDDFLWDSEYRICLQVNDSLTDDDLDLFAKTYETTDAFNCYQTQLNFAL